MVVTVAGAVALDKCPSCHLYPLVRHHASINHDGMIGFQPAVLTGEVHSKLLRDVEFQHGFQLFGRLSLAGCGKCPRAQCTVLSHALQDRRS